ncbi:MAG: glycosyltransferase family 2 protein [Bacteroidota bacterium]
MSSSSNSLVSVIIVNYNGAQVIEDCLRSVFAQPYRPIEVIVVDNDSSDESVRLIGDRFVEVKLIQNEKNLGFAGGNNRGVAEAKGEYVVLLNNDAVVESSWLSGLVGMLHRPNVGAATSKVITERVPDRFYEMNGTINYLGYNIMREFSDLSQVFFAGGASLTFRRDVVGKPFINEYFLYQEDVYLSWKLRLRGMTVAMAQDSVVHHKGSVSARQQKNELVTYYQERNRMLNTLLFYEARTLFLLLPYFLADALAKVLLSIIGGRKSFVGIIRAYWWICCHISWIASERTSHQALRVVPDSTITAMMSYKVVEGDSAVAQMLNRLSKSYARLVGLAFHG